MKLLSCKCRQCKSRKRRGILKAVVRHGRRSVKQTIRYHVDRNMPDIDVPTTIAAPYTD